MITFILAVRNRRQHAVHSLPSVMRQAGACDGEVIVVDQDSEAETASYLMGVCEESGARYVRLDRGGPFSRSWTLNVGGRLATKPLLSFCDVDVVLDDNFAEVVIRTYVDVFHRHGCVINCFPYQVAEEPTAKFKATSDMSVLRNGDHCPWWTLGAGSNADTETFRAIGGFDEEYDGWGCEDDDLFQRLRARGCGWACISPAAKCWHMWHPTVPRKDDHEPPNRARLAESVERIARGDLVRNEHREPGNLIWRA